MSKYPFARKHISKKMRGKSNADDLFFNQNRNLEENKRIKNEFIGFIKEEKDDNKNLDVNNTNKSDVD